MKKYLLLLILPFLFLSDVKADTISLPSLYSLSDYSSNINLNEYDEVFQEYLSNYSNTYPYYISYISSNYEFTLIGSKQLSNFSYISYPYSTFINILAQDIIIIQYYSNSIHVSTQDDSSSYNINLLEYNNNGYTSDSYQYGYYDSNVDLDFLLSDFSFNEINVTGFYSDTISLLNNQSIPKLKDLLQYSSWSEYENNHLENYTTVNLDNYEYVLLSLKNYGNISPFQTNLQVKGQIGITPIYNYGQTSKDAVTGSKVQDRCNVEYSDYTTYPFYIIQSDIQNNAIFAVKSCSSGSSFKFDNTIFNITYITSQNKDNPTITINGNTYNVIPYDDLPSTATQNEEDNYIPGQSGYPLNETLDSAIKNAQQKMSEIWNSLTYFTSFIGQIFSSLPSEIHTILISAFIIMIMLGIIKIFLGK